MLSATQSKQKKEFVDQPKGQISPLNSKANQSSVLWFDTRGLLNKQKYKSIAARIDNSPYQGLIVALADLANSMLSNKLNKIVEVNSSKDLEEVQKHNIPSQKLVIACSDIYELAKIKQSGFKTCLLSYIVDSAGLHQAIELGKRHDYLVLLFKDPTNIPLELAIASLQFTDTVLLKQIAEPNADEDALISLAVMEVGSDGVVFSPTDPDIFDRFSKRAGDSLQTKINLEVAEVTRLQKVGIGQRACIDLVSNFTPDEGLLIGSTSQGGILCCPEVFHLPYMELRPFRVNAGGIHSYVYNFGNRTNYISELMAGDSMMIVDHDGNTRQAHIGRVKIETRPLLLIQTTFASGNSVNVILQDDWHVRIYSDQGKDLNISELKLGDKVLAYQAQPGRHVGIKVDEYILEK